MNTVKMAGGAMARTPQPDMTSRDITGLKYFRQLAPLLERLHVVGWTIEIFFQWLKHVLGCRHLLIRADRQFRSLPAINSPREPARTNHETQSKASHQQSCRTGLALFHLIVSEFPRERE
jgi:hypothetical protein